MQRKRSVEIIGYHSSIEISGVKTVGAGCGVHFREFLDDNCGRSKLWQVVLVCTSNKDNRLGNLRLFSNRS